MITLTNTIRFRMRSAGRDVHPSLNLVAGDLTPSTISNLYHPFPENAFAGGPKFAASQLPEAWCNVSHWQFTANLSALGRSLSVNTIGPAGADYSAVSEIWTPADAPDRFDLLAYTDFYSNLVVLHDSWVESLNDRRSITAQLSLVLGHAVYYDGKWWARVRFSAAAVQDIDTSGTGQFLDEDIETTITGYSSDPEGTDIGIRFLGQPILMSPLTDGVGDVTFTASIEAATYYADWFPIAA